MSNLFVICVFVCVIAFALSDPIHKKCTKDSECGHPLEVCHDHNCFVSSFLI